VVFALKSHVRHKVSVFLIVISALFAALLLAACPKPGAGGGETASTGASDASTADSTSVATASSSGNAASPSNADSASRAEKVDKGVDALFPDEDEKAPENGKEWKSMKFISPAFANGGNIPAKYTADGEGVSPPLAIANPPDVTASLVLVVDDPDAPRGVWDHWILYNIPPGTTTIREGDTPNGAMVGSNSWGRREYGGPAPPSGTHHYRFKLYALDILVGLDAGANKSQVEQAMTGHILAKAEFVGLYSKSR
jgi:hypothetical protein